MATLKPVKQKNEKGTSSIFAFDPAATRRVHPCSYFSTCFDFWLDFAPVVRMACKIKLLESEATTGFFVLLGEQGNKAVLDWVMKGLIPSRYECPKCKKDMRLVERKGTIDGFEWRCRVRSKENLYFVCRNVTAAKVAGYKDLSEFVRAVKVGAQEMGHGILKVAMKFGFSRLTISRVSCEYQESDDWKHVTWSDKSHFQLNPPDGNVRIWRQPHESMDPTCQQGNVQAVGGSVIVDELGEFQQDNTTSEFRHFHWPPKSPDMNIIEYIWKALQRAVQKRSPPPLTPTHLWRALQDSWYQLPPALLQILIKSMPRRVVALLCACGNPTRY
ncbi:transposable element Tcb2 transposase [Trichonephila clavipes]|uniref:Transposable element Tcb2 transposase n=1 Tax=Trichonephila clavipes TaxID=2585209 RepID=A0A8X6SWN2_TRICX|nr:transposable element Tcb2 transposase [Trichonephila clavipes]